MDEIYLQLETVSFPQLMQHTDKIPSSFFCQGFLSARNLNPNTSIKIIGEDLEPSEFKQFFSSWEPVVPFGKTQTFQAGKGVVSKGMQGQLLT